MLYSNIDVYQVFGPRRRLKIQITLRWACCAKTQRHGGLCCALQVLIGTGCISIGNFGSQYRPNSRKFLQFFQPDSDWNQWNQSVLLVPSPINSNWYQVEPVGTGRKESDQCIYSRRSPDHILNRGK